MWENDIGDEGCVAVAESIKNNNTITRLKYPISFQLYLYSFIYLFFSLRRNSIGDVGAAAIGDSLKTNSTIITLKWETITFTEFYSNVCLSFEKNNIRDEGGKAIAEAIKYNNTIKNLW